MIDFEVYKIMHIVGIALLLMGLAGVLFAHANTPAVKVKLRLLGFLTHGLGLLLVLTGGFGMAARMGLVQGLPGWIYAKLAIWIFFGAAVSLSKRKSNWAPLLVALYTVLVGSAAYLAIYKPF